MGTRGFGSNGRSSKGRRSCGGPLGILEMGRPQFTQSIAVSNVLAISVRHHLTDEEYVITKRNATTIVVAAPAIEDY